MALTKISGSILKDPLNLGGEVSIGGTLTYQDVTNVDAIGIITARAGVNVSGGQLDVGSNVKLGNAGVITATNFKSGVTNVHNLGVTLTGGQLDVGSNIKLGTAGVVTATSFVGNGSGLTGVSGVSVANQADNRLITATGTTDSLNGEANLTFNGTRLDIAGSAQNQLQLNSTHSDGPNIVFERSSSALGYLGSAAANTGGTATDLALRAQNNLLFASNGGNERLRITSTGRIEVGTGSGVFAAAPIEVKVSSSSGWGDYPEHISLVDQKAYDASDNGGGIVFSGKYNNAGNVTTYGSIHGKKSTTGDGNFGGILTFNTREHGNSNFERMRIDSYGRVFINSVGPTTPTADYRSLNLVAHAHTEAGISFSRSHTLMGSGSTGGQSIILLNDGSLSINTHNVGEKVRILGGTDNVLQVRGGNNMSIVDYAPNHSFSGSYVGFHCDNHGNTLVGLNAHLNYSGTSGTHQWKQTNAHGSIGSAGMFIGGNGSNNNSNITFFRNSQGSSAGTTFAQTAWKFQIGSDLRQNFNERYLQRGFFKTDTANQTASNFPLAASGIGGYAYGYQEAYSTSGGAWNHPYPNLVLGYHTGMQFGAYHNYGGCRFYADHPSTTSTIYFSVGNGGSGVHVTNTFTAGSNKGFRIAHPHPSKKYTHDLVHNAIEAPQMDLIYRGKVDLVAGSATVNIDTKSNMTEGTFVLLNRDIQCFTSNETGWTAVKGSVSGNILTITAQDNSCTDTISWMVVGERQDDKIKSSELTTADGDLIVEPLTIEETHM